MALKLWSQPSRETYCHYGPPDHAPSGAKSGSGTRPVIPAPMFSLPRHTVATPTNFVRAPSCTAFGPAPGIPKIASPLFPWDLAYCHDPPVPAATLLVETHDQCPVRTLLYHSRIDLHGCVRRYPVDEPVRPVRIASNARTETFARSGCGSKIGPSEEGNMRKRGLTLIIEASGSDVELGRPLDPDT